MKTYFPYLILLVLFTGSCKDVFFEEEPTNDPIGNFESLWNTFNEKYAVFQQRGVDWQELYSTYRPQLNANTTDDELFEIITSMLSHLDDGHVSLLAANRPFWSGHEEFRVRTKDELFNYFLIPNNYLSNGVKVISNQYAYGKINGDIGYIFIGSLGGDQPKFIDDFIAEMKDMKGIIIDLRHNNGGDFTNGEVIASRFAGQKTLAFRTTPKDGPGPNDFGETFDYFIEASGDAQFNKTVVVLTDNYTISAGENLVLYLKTQPNVIVIGENTAGAMGEKIEKEMPNGWIYSITGQVVTAPDGVSYEGPGIPPDIYFQNTFEDMDNGIDKLLERGIDEIYN